MNQAIQTLHKKISSSHFVNTMLSGNRGLSLINYDRSRFHDCTFEICGKNNHVFFDTNCLLTNCHIRVCGNNNRLIFGKNDRIDCGSFNIEGNDNSLVVGAHFLNKGVEIGVSEGTTLTIGDFCMFSTNVILMTGDAHPIFNFAHTMRTNAAKSISLGDRVWIGTRSIILKGTELSHDVIVGAGSVVSGKFAETNCILAGNPAKIVKHGIVWEKDF